MTLKIKLQSGNLPVAGSGHELIPLGSNPCLPGIIAGTFAWNIITIELSDQAGNSMSLRACLIGKKIVLLPHFSYGPALPAEIVSQIIETLKAEGYQCEWRLTSGASEFCITNKVTTLIRLSHNVRSQFESFNSNLRRKIRKCSSNGVEIRKGNLEMLPDFYKVYSRRMHQLGSPSLPGQWYSNLLEQYTHGKVSVWCAYLNGKPVGGAFVLEYQGYFEACWFATLKQYNKLYVSYGLIWEMMCDAISQAGITFSLGRSTVNSSVHRYKQQWGGEDVQLYWNHSHPPGRSIRSFPFVSHLWKLIPFSIAQKAGPWFAGKIY